MRDRKEQRLEPELPLAPLLLELEMARLELEPEPVCHLLLNSQSRQYEECNLKTVVLQNSDNAGSSAHESGNLSIKHLQIQNHLY
ncbi:Os11g0267600 [Oryza sativa Japonica Group]|uniref:Os11g0267600 protein n=1 Tax=Oryza sativa subsp. japonica TaxID=39947 RepID=C7J850_ORYSJ|nr:Os11g0267600 [Oryza sativa Japonica Group]|eukprot:NP_001176474.1 Os11g0267600 [Oryza sativa Japonica Group]